MIGYQWNAVLSVYRAKLHITIGYNQWRLLKKLLSTVTKSDSEDKTLYLHFNQPLVIAAVVGRWCALNVHRGYNLKIRSLNDGQCCNKDERLSIGSYHWNGYELAIPEVSRSFKIMKERKDVLSTRREQAYLSNHHKVLCFQGVGTERCGNGFTVSCRTDKFR